jgi:hypothetical protein
MIRNDLLMFEDDFGDDLLVDASDVDEAEEGHVTLTITQFCEGIPPQVGEFSLDKEDCLALAAFLKEKAEKMEVRTVAF